MKKIFNKVNRYYKHYGALKLCKKFVTIVLSPIFLYYEMVVMRNDLKRGVAGKLEKASAGVSVEVLSKKDFASLESAKKEMAPGFVQQRIDAGEVCFIAKEGTRICAHTWLAPGPRTVSNEEKPVLIREGDAYMHDSWTDSAYRGRGLNTLIQGFACNYFRKQGYPKIYCMVYSDNYPSIKAHENVGFEITELIRYFRFRFMKKAWYISQRIAAHE